MPRKSSFRQQCSLVAMTAIVGSVLLFCEIADIGGSRAGGGALFLGIAAGTSTSFGIRRLLTKLGWSDAA